MSKDNEIAQVVDETDTLLCYKRRGDLTLDDTVRCTSIWIEDGKGNALSQKRSSTLKYMPSLWDGAGGGMVNKNETPDQNAHKELREELGITSAELTPVKKVFIKGNDKQGNTMCYWFKGIVNQPISSFKLQAEEVETLQWINKKKLFADVRKNPKKYMYSAAQWEELFDD